MLTPAENEQLARVGPGTPAGELMRRYWHPVAASAELRDQPTKLAKILGESLVLYRDRSGRLGLIQDYCPHRGTSLLYGIPENSGLRCPYHGWKFDGGGRCVDMPAEPKGHILRERVQIVNYPVEELGGLIFAYLGPPPAPLLPRWNILMMETLVKDETVFKEIGTVEVGCNWLQIMENSVDTIHREFLHYHFTNYVFERLGDEPIPVQRRQIEVAFEESRYGITKRDLLEGGSYEDESWTVGQTLVFPNLIATGSRKAPVLQIRVPMDDTTTRQYFYCCYILPPDLGVPAQEDVSYFDIPMPPPGKIDWQLFAGNVIQDVAIVASQGPIYDRSRERLGDSDQGINIYRKMLAREIRKVEHGEDPKNVFRDPEETRCPVLPFGKSRGGSGPRFSRYGPASNVQMFSPLISYLRKQGANFAKIFGRDLLVDKK
jgi:5,5'-dehydrodivanillate O-demethylase oxygenase subunit